MTKLNERQAQLRDQHIKDLNAAADVVTTEYHSAQEAYEELERAVQEYDLEVEKVNRFLMSIDADETLEELEFEQTLPMPRGHDENIAILSAMEEGEEEKEN